MSLNEVLRIQKDRKKRVIKTFEKIFERVKIRITHSAKYGATHCYYNIPQLLYGLPSVNIEECADYVYNKLKKEGFVVYRIQTTHFLISWEESVIEEKVREKERKRKEKEEQEKIDEIEDQRREELMGFLMK